MRRSILKIEQLVLDNRLYPRVESSERVIKTYMSDMNRGDKFPPLYVGLFKGKYFLIDGRHRLEAYKSILPKKEWFVSCEIKTNFVDFDEMFLAGFRENAKHGYRLSKQDKWKVANMLSEMKYDVGDISKLTGIQMKKVENAIKGKIQHVLIKDKIRSGEMPDIITEKMPGKESVRIMKDKEIKKIEEANKDEFQLFQLNEIYGYIKGQDFDLNHKGIEACLKKIKKVLHKRFPKL
ncbi:hypothetical protein LCGC14_1547630 [marine sediment metagenome]|uniref:ParB/Sulfiredoxin domain-containing protein n=1 Tax=marine sediment metagenome TaxID=412755 RepID=A0A0F9IR94_9ZZZZ